MKHRFKRLLVRVHDAIHLTTSGAPREVLLHPCCPFFDRPTLRLCDLCQSFLT